MDWNKVLEDTGVDTTTGDSLDCGESDMFVILGATNPYAEQQLLYVVARSLPKP